ncbi:acyltransferase [Planctomonas sp. JC2975]|uniref:acyltransferase family protein n=1 Tax=Planctomonas sp. JC2975 TaxID=2729626 RepID=UPI0014762C15|nr:acyltransferase [Planctomonas sp. JC2975]
MDSPETVKRPTRRRKLYELEVVRVLTFACVIGVHVVSHTAQGSAPIVGSLILLHFTREVFFALTGFVLTLSYLRKPKPMREFWPRRFLLVGVPYLVWSLIYCIISAIGKPFDLWQFLQHYFWASLTGTAYYHMYFLLVTMQIYLLFPLLVWLVKATRRWHWLLVSLSFALQLTISAFDQYKPGSMHWINLFSNVINYQAFIIAGAVGAYHSTAVLQWVRVHRRLIAVITPIAAALTIGAYLLQLSWGYSVYAASTAYQPAVLVWSAVVAVALLAIGAWWVDRRPEDPHRTLDYLSDRSFGVFLAHPLVLWLLLLVAGGLLNSWPPLVSTIVAYPIVALGALGIADVARRSILSLPLAGRPRSTRRKNIP